MKRTYWAIVSEKQCIYSGLRNWMNASMISASSLARMMYGDGNDSQRMMLARALKGGNCSKKTIDKILEVSRLTYEEAFGKG